jgi:radical SAM superfamily enzyme YgiQ (UPF0313 family)
MVLDKNGYLLETKDIGFNTVFPQGKDFENKILTYIHLLNPMIKICAGGSKTGPQYNNRNIDYVLLGYSEISIVNLVNYLAHGKELFNSQQNIWGCTIIDDRFAKSYDFPQEDMEWLDTDVVNHQVLPLEIARGCIFRCKFCAYPMNGKKQLDFVKNTDILFRELTENYYKFGITHYIIVDDTFNDHNEKLETLAAMITRLDFQPIFWAYHRLDLICTRPETLPLLYQIGVRAMYFGIETLHLPTGRIIGKGFDRAKQIDMIKYIKKNYPDISVHGSFIVGLPHEPLDSIHDTFNQLLNKEIGLDCWSVRALRISLPEDNAFNSEITLDYPKFGYKNNKISNNDRLINWENEYLSYEQSVKLANEFMRKSRTLNHYHISGITAMELVTIGLDFSVTCRTAFTDFDFHNIQTNIKPQFTQKYKNKLLKLVSKQ